MLNVAVIGFGTVGSGVCELLTNNADIIEKNAGEKINLKYICDIREFPDSPFADKMVKDFEVIANDPEVDVVVETEKPVTAEAVNAALKEAADGKVLCYSEEPLVSSDIIGITQGSLFDATQTMLTKISDGLYQVQVVAWYDNENSYTCQFVRLAKAFAQA